MISWETVVLPLGRPADTRRGRRRVPVKTSPAELDGAAAKKPRGTVELILKYEPVEEEVGVGDFSGCKSCALTSHEKEIQKHKKMTSFQRQIAKALGISKGNRTFEALRNKLLTDDGSLSSINDADLKVLARHTPTRMDVSNGVPLWAVYPDFLPRGVYERNFVDGLAVRRESDTQRIEFIKWRRACGSLEG